MTMRFIKSSMLLLFFSFCLPLGLLAQSDVVGDWLSKVPTDDGGTMSINVSIKADGSYTVDFGADGQAEVTGKYEVSNGQMTIQNVSGDECTGKGVYNFKVTDTDLIMNRVSDPCEGRSGPEGLMQFKRQ